MIDNRYVEDLRVLVTNSGWLCAYAAVRSLRAHARLITVTYREALPANIALSRYVDRKYRLELPATGWQSGDITRENTRTEASYIQAITAICAREGINVLIPTIDEEVYLFSKNRSHFLRQGITTMAPDFEAYAASADKYRAMQAAQAVGFPHPRTLLPESPEHVHELGRQIGFPLVIKARFSAGARGVRLVQNQTELTGAVNQIKGSHGWPVLQEYIPGGKEPSVNLILDARGNLLLLYTLRKLRYAAASRSTCVQITEPLPETERAIDLARHLGLTGYVAIQTKLDHRDGRHKLIEINPRWGGNAAISVKMGIQMGINPMLLSVRAIRGEEHPPRRLAFPAGLIGMSPVEDVLAFRKYLQAALFGRSDNRPDNPLPTLKKLFYSYWYAYSRRDKTLDYFWDSLTDDRRMAINTFSSMIRNSLRSKGLFIPWGDVLPGR